MPIPRLEIFRALHSRREPSVSTGLRKRLALEYENWLGEVKNKREPSLNDYRYKQLLKDTKMPQISTRNERLRGFVAATFVKFFVFVEKCAAGIRKKDTVLEARIWGEMIQTGLALESYYARKGDKKEEAYFEQMADPTPEDILPILAFSLTQSLGKRKVIRVVSNFLY